jgi:predicted RNA-binding Zn-ribbon protein involved in translation (DUF1610 family)
MTSREWNPGDLSFGFHVVDPKREGPAVDCPSCGAMNWEPHPSKDTHYCVSCGTEVDAAPGREETV